VIKAYAFVKSDALADLAIEIAGILASIIGLVNKVVPTLLANLIPLLRCAIDIILNLKLTALINVLQLSVG
jgi:hypothetical protein